MTPTLVHRGGRANGLWALVAGCLCSLRWALMTGCLKGREIHPQENDYGTRNGEWQMETKDAMTPVPAGTSKRLTKWLI